MIMPTIHMNGTSLQSLIENNERAYHAVVTAIDALAEAAPNGRDYYPQGNIEGTPALYVAQDQHSERMAKLLQVKRELGQIQDYLFGEEMRRRAVGKQARKSDS